MQRYANKIGSLSTDFHGEEAPRLNSPGMHESVTKMCFPCNLCLPCALSEKSFMWSESYLPDYCGVNIPTETTGIHFCEGKHLYKAGQIPEKWSRGTVFGRH